ncbi:hypothetical protein SDC9_162702 [bioreactor metagenome]|uniref:Uncharacterized protein n=1 Tax=bioreactor metagenome TaxID=1076179 RepID=A0A645FLU1_9ZZZZ
MLEIVGHNQRADRRANAPAAMQKAHVARLVVQRDVVVQRRVNRARAESQRNGEQQQKDEVLRVGKPKQRRRRHQHADRRHSARSEPANGAHGEQAGHHRARRNEDGNQPRVGDGHAQLRIRNRPGCAEQRVRQAEADERQINENQ